MGFYIDPKDCSKEEWLLVNAAKGQKFDPMQAPDYKLRSPDCHFVCLVDNGSFTAAAIAFNEREFKVFAQLVRRRKVWMQVPDAKLIEVCPSVASVLA